MQPRRRGPPWLLIGSALALSTLLIAGVGMLRLHLRTKAQRDLLERMPFMVTGWNRPSSEPTAATERVIVARLDMQGAPRFRTGPVPVWGGMPGQLLDMADAQLPPWPAREEVRAALAGNRMLGRHWTQDRDGEVLVQTLAQPVPEGGALYILAGLYVHRFQQPAMMALFSVIADLLLILVVLIAVVAQRRSRRGPPVPGP